jgi:hypothetical protein
VKRFFESLSFMALHRRITRDRWVVGFGRGGFAVLDLERGTRAPFGAGREGRTAARHARHRLVLGIASPHDFLWEPEW